MEQLKQLFFRALSIIEDTLFPDRCIGCRKEKIILCENCVERLPEADEPPVGEALFEYRHPTVRRALWLFKYRNRRDLAEVLSRPLSELILAELGERFESRGQKLLIVPIPLSPQKLRTRGYNQTALLAESLGRQLQIPVAPVLAKIIETPSQMSLSRSKRLENLKGAFEATRLLRGTSIILIDDIITTGATLREARKALRDAGAKKIFSFALAH